MPEQKNVLGEQDRMSTEQTEMAMTQVTAHLRVGGPNDAGFYKVALSKSGRTHIEWLSADEAIAFAAALSAERVNELEANREFSQQGIDTLEQRLAEVTRHLTEAQTSGWCDVCCGTGKPTADVPCMCGGTGIAADAVIHLRERLFKVEQRAEAAEATIEGMLTVGANFARRQLDTTPTAPAAPAAGTLEHRCGVRGFADSGDECPACADAARRRAGTPAKEDA